LRQHRLRQHSRLLTENLLDRGRGRADRGNTASQIHRPMAAKFVPTWPPPPRTLLTVQTVFSRVLRILMILLLARPSRLNAMSMPSARRKV